MIHAYDGKIVEKQGSQVEDEQHHETRMMFIRCRKGGSVIYQSRRKRIVKHEVDGRAFYYSWVYFSILRK